MALFAFHPPPRGRLVFVAKAGPRPSWVDGVSARTRRKMVGPLLADLEKLRSSLRERDLARAVLSEDTARIVEASQVDRVGSIVGAMGEPIEDAVRAGGRLAMAEVSAPAVALDMQRPRVRKWLKDNAARLVKEVNGTSRRAIRAIVRDGFAAGRHPRAMAKDIRAVVGLTEPQSISVARRRAAMVEAGVAEGKVEKRIARYAERLLKQRAETIARTESMSAVNQGRSAMWRQLQDDGGLEPDARKEWLTADDERVCPICGPLDEHKPIPLDGSYDTAVGLLSHPPAHPGCRCTEVLA